MTGLDLLVVALAAVAGALGHGLGLIRRLASLVGMLAGLVLGALVLPDLLEATDLGAPGRRTAAVIGLVALGGAGTPPGCSSASTCSAAAWCPAATVTGTAWPAPRPAS